MTVVSTLGRLADGIVVLIGMVVLYYWLRFATLYTTPMGMAEALTATFVLICIVAFTQGVSKVWGWL
jgi:uncharacterized membrane protein